MSGMLVVGTSAQTSTKTSTEADLTAIEVNTTVVSEKHADGGTGTRTETKKTIRKPPQPGAVGGGGGDAQLLNPDLTPESSTNPKPQKGGKVDKAPANLTIQNEEMIQRILKPSRRPKSSNMEPTYCFCHKPDDGSPMILCNLCKTWFHCSCINVDTTEFEKIKIKDDDWYCGDCQPKLQPTQPLFVTCPHCPSDLNGKTYKGERGLRRHIKSAHKDLATPSQVNSQITPEFNEPFHAIISKARKSIKLLSRIPKGARSFAAEKLSNTIDSAISKNDEESWKSVFLWSYSSLCLPQKRKKSSLTSLVKQNIKDGQLKWTTELRKNKTSVVARKIEEKVFDGNIKNAMRLLTSDDSLAPDNESTYEALLSKHPSPSRVLNLPAPPTSSYLLQIDQKAVLNALNKYPKDSAAGMDGIKPCYLKDMTAKHCGPSGLKLLTSLTNLVNFLLSGKLCDEMCEYMYGAILIALKKKDGGIRPIAIGNLFRRLAAKVGTEKSSKMISQSYLWPKQVGVSISGGCEAAVHCTRKYLQEVSSPSKVLLKIDFKNAFNSVERDTILSQIQSKTPELYPFMWQAYSKPSTLIYGSKTISSAVGCQQGCPAGCLGFSLALHPIVETLSSEFVLFYLDDGTICGDYETVIADLKNLIEQSALIGLQINVSKCELFVPMTDMKDAIVSRFREATPEIKILEEDEVTLLGSPLTEAAAKNILTNKIGLYSRLSSRLKTLNPHVALYLLKNCMAIPMMMFLLRTTPLWGNSILEQLDSIIKDALESLLNCKLCDDSWNQASLPVSCGGIGIRKLIDVALPAYCSSTYAANNIANSILNAPLIEENDSLSSAEELWKILTNCDKPAVPHIQKNWDLPLIAKSFDSLTTNDDKTKARLLAVNQKESGDWINAVPSPQLGTLLDPETLRISVALRLGLKIYSCHTCSCGKIADEFGYHALSCTKSAGRSSRHHALNDIIKRALLSADVPSILEPLGIDRDDGKRVDGITMIPWNKGRQLTWDATCVDPLCESYLSSSSKKAGSAANAAAQRKHQKYTSVKDSFFFVAFAVDCFGSWSDEALRFGKELGTRMSTSTGEPRSFLFFRQRISIAIQRGNATSVYGTIPKDIALDELFYL